MLPLQFSMSVSTDWTTTHRTVNAAITILYVCSYEWNHKADDDVCTCNFWQFPMSVLCRWDYEVADNDYDLQF